MSANVFFCRRRDKSSSSSWRAIHKSSKFRALHIDLCVNNNNLLGAGQRPNIVPGQEVKVPGSITDRLRSDPNDDRYLNPAAFSQAPAGTFGNAPRMLDGIYSPWRNSTDMRIRKDIGLGGSRRFSIDMEVINLFDNPWYTALQSTAQGNGNFGRVNAQANYSRTMQFTGRLSF